LNASRILALVGKELKRLTREPSVLFMAIVFPLILTLAFGASFGALGGSETRYPVAVVNQDTGMWSSVLKTNLTGSQVLSVRNYTDTAEAGNDLKQGKVKAVLVIPTGFTRSVDSYRTSPSDSAKWYNTSLALSVDKGSMVANAAIPPIIQQVVTALVTGKNTAARLPITVGSPTQVESQTISQFAYMAPGMFGYAAIFLIMIVGGSITSEREQGILRRISVTPTTIGDILASQVVSNMIIGVVQVAIVYAASYLMGFRAQGGILGIALAFTLVMVLTTCSVGLGLIVATFARNAGAATGISFVFVLPLMFLGTFVPAPENVARFVPTWYVTDALTSILLRGAPITSPSIISDFMTVVVVSIVIMLAGVFLFRRFGKS
jgi:ABC-2 type transport system permease protein